MKLLFIGFIIACCVSWCAIIIAALMVASNSERRMDELFARAPKQPEPTETEIDDGLFFHDTPEEHREWNER